MTHSQQFFIACLMTKRANAPDKWQAHRDALGAERVDTFLAKFGLGPAYKPKAAAKRSCPKCGKGSATVREAHADTGMDEMELRCPDCGHEESI